MPVHVPRTHLRQPLVARADLRVTPNAREVELNGLLQAPVERVHLPELVAELRDLALAHVRVERQVDRDVHAARGAGERVASQHATQSLRSVRTEF